MILAVSTRNVSPRWPIGASPADARGTAISVAAKTVTKTTRQRRMFPPRRPSHDGTLRGPRRRVVHPSAFLAGHQRFQHRGQIGLDTVLIDAGLVQRTAAVFQFEQRKQKMFSADVVVAEAKCLTEGQLERFDGDTAERDELRWGVQ